MSHSRRHVLLLGHFPKRMAATVRDHRDGLVAFSRYRVRWLSVLHELPRQLDLSCFDGLILHYSLTACYEGSVSRRMRERIASYQGAKGIFVQDEYRHVDATIAAICEMRMDVLYTCIPEYEVEKVYSAEKLPGVKKVSVLTGYVPEYLRERAVRPVAERRLDVVYRGRRLPYWLGALGQEKTLIASRFGEEARRCGLRTDISCEEGARLYGDQWLKFLESSRAVLGTESGASVVDFTGVLQKRVEEYMATHPGADFETVQALFLREYEGRVDMRQVSPRIFEAAGCRTLMVNYEGRYSGILRPWGHYVPLRKDHSNLGDVINAIRDDRVVEQITDRAYRDLVASGRYSYRVLAKRFDEGLATVIQRRTPVLRSYSSGDFMRIARRDSWRVRARMRNTAFKHWVVFGLLPVVVPGRYRPAVYRGLQRIYRSLRRGPSRKPNERVG